MHWATPCPLRPALQTLAGMHPAEASSARARSAPLRLLALADEAPRADPARIAVDNGVHAVVTLGDLEPESIASLAGLAIPLLGVHGNHDAEGQLGELGIADVHLARTEIGDWTFAGFEGCVRYRRGPHQYSQAEAASLARNLPPADVLLCHAPPAGIDDEPDDPAHTGFAALREWVERRRPRYLLHGHTQPDPRTRVHRFGDTEIIWVRGATVVELRR